MNIFQLQELPAELVVLVKDREVFANRRDQVVVHCDGDVVSEQRCMAGGRVIADLRGKNVGSDRGSQRGGQAEFVIIKFLVELVKGPASQIPVLFVQKRQIGALGEGDFLAIAGGQNTELHVDIREL